VKRVLAGQSRKPAEFLCDISGENLDKQRDRIGWRSHSPSISSSVALLMDTKEQGREQVLAIFAHELRQPLASIQLAVQGMTEAPELEAVTRELCEIVDRQSRYLTRMIDHALNDCRESSTKLCLQKEWVDLGVVMAGAIEATRALFWRRQHRLSVSLPQDRLWINANALRLQQIVINLLANAAKYTEPGGRIELSVEKMGDLLLIEVTDNGVGISEELLPRIFDLFSQGKEPLHDSFSGLGIGLALVKSLVEQHGGTISARSAGAGAGSTFAVRMPGTTPCLHHGDPDSITSARLFPAVGNFEAGPMCDA
jgi:signal transduction histidine kinase